MTRETLSALKGSIKKWERIVAGTGEDKGPDNCPLCKLFFHIGCMGCPVMDRSKQFHCNGTPYEAWSNLDYVDLYPLEGPGNVIAKDEVRFLKSLLPRRRAKKS